MSAAEQATPATDVVEARLLAAFPDVSMEHDARSGELTIVLAPEALADVARFLRDDSELRFARLSDLCGVDNLHLGRERRFAVAYHLHSLLLHRWVRIRVDLDEDEPVVPSVVAIWPAANWPERETFDLYGIQFAGHPALERLLLPDDWEGHPLRKDYPFQPEAVEFSANVDRVNAGKVQRRPDWKPWRTDSAPRGTGR